MKNLFLATISLIFFSFIGHSQDVFISSEMYHEVYEDNTYKVLTDASLPYENSLIITFDYAAKKVKFVESDGTTIWLQATWTKEINPDAITGDEDACFMFDPTKNSKKMSALKIFRIEDGYMLYKIEANKEVIKISGVEPDIDGNGLGDISEYEASENSENYEEMGDGVGAPMYYLNLSNTTEYTIYFSTNIENTSGDWILANEWISIPAGESYMIGNTFSDHFYYYAYCKDNKGEFVIWEGTDQYHQVGGSEGSYGFRHVGLSDGVFDEDGEVWFMSLTL